MTTPLSLFKPSPTPWIPHAYQQKAVKFLLEHAAGALFQDPGLGKTAETLAAIKILKRKHLVNKVLIIAPLRVCYNVWPTEAAKWTDFNKLTIEVLHGPKKDAALQYPADIYVINPEGLDWLLQVEKTKTPTGKTRVNLDLARWKTLGFDTLVVDELSKFRHINTDRFKGLKLVLGTFGRRWGLTGSPASNGLLDLFGQCYMLDQGRSLGVYISHYRAQYFLPTPDGFGWVIRPGAEEEIYDRVRPLVLRMAAADYLDMPALIENNIYVDLPDATRRIYDELEHDLIARLEKGLVVAANAAAASMFCRQVVNGGLYLSQDVQALVKLPKSQREWVNLHTAKVDALADLVDELQGSPLLVAYDFGHDLDRLRARFPNAAFASDYSAAKFTALEDQWNRGEVPLLFGHPQSVGHGLNLQGAGNHVCWHSLTYDYELYDQFIRRVLRQGSKAKKVFVHHIIARDTIDEVIMRAIKSKRRGQNALFEALRDMK